MTTTPDNAAPDFPLVPERLVVLVEGGEVVLTFSQFCILAVLMGEPNHVFTKEELIKRAFTGRVSGRTVDVHIKDLRRKLESHDWRVQTVRRQGYRYLLEPSNSKP